MPALRTLVLAGALAALALPVAAQRGGEIVGSLKTAPGVLGPAERFKAADSNSDGKVSKDEFAASLNPDARPYLNAIWVNRDSNKDGWLTQEEMTSNGAILRPGASGTDRGAAIAAAAAPSPKAGQ